LNSPTLYNDFNGENPLLLVGACVIGGTINGINYAINGKNPLVGFGIGFAATGVGIITTAIAGPIGFAEGTATTLGILASGVANTAGNRFQGVYNSPDPAFDYAIGAGGALLSAKIGIAVAGKTAEGAKIAAAFIGESTGNNVINVGLTGVNYYYPDYWSKISNPLRQIIPGYPYIGR
jgi:hypothetical protein